MGDLSIAIDNLNAIITELQRIMATCTDPNSCPPQTKDRYQSLLDQATVALNSFYRYSSETLAAYNDALISNDNLANSLDDLTTIAKEMDTEQYKIITDLDTEKSTKMKQIQFNSYYAQMNSYNANIMKILVLSSILMMINIYLYTRKYISDHIYTIISIVIISITIIIISRMIYSEFQRSNYNFNTFKWAQP